MSSFRKAVPLWHEELRSKIPKILIKVKINCHKTSAIFTQQFETAEATQYTNQTYLTVLAEEHQQKGGGSKNTTSWNTLASYIIRLNQNTEEIVGSFFK
jgi:phosphoribosylanthranilate isomerase